MTISSLQIFSLVLVTANYSPKGSTVTIAICIKLFFIVVAGFISLNLDLGMLVTDSQGCVDAAMVCQEHLFMDIFHSKICALAKALLE